MVSSYAQKLMWELLSVPREIFSRWKYTYFLHSFDISSKRNVFSHEKFYCKISDLPYFNCSSYMCIIFFLIIWINFLLGETRMACVYFFLILLFFLIFLTFQDMSALSSLYHKSKYLSGLFMIPVVFTLVFILIHFPPWSICILTFFSFFY